MNTPSNHSSIVKMMLTGRMGLALIMGFASGLPLLLTMSVLQAWMTEEGVDLTVIGLIALVQIPYTWKILWAPLLDRYTIGHFGRRRGWLLASQVALIAAIAGLGFSNPSGNFTLMVIAAVCVAFFSASQDIVIDAYRRETLADNELGMGSSLYINGYRLGMMLSSGGGLILADRMAWSSVYLIMAVFMVPCLVVTLLAPEPDMPLGKPRTLKAAVIEPLSEYFHRQNSLLILAFILCYKIGDSMASAMTIPFYLDIGFTKTQIGAVVKLFGTGAVIGGALFGGVLMLKIGINRSLWVFGVLQALSTACFAILAKVGPSLNALAGVIAFENVSSGMGTAAFVAYMASLTNKKFTATQYALLTSLMAFPRVLASAPTGFLAKHLGWMEFFIFCALIALPGMLMLQKIAPFREK